MSFTHVLPDQFPRQVPIGKASDEVVLEYIVHLFRSRTQEISDQIQQLNIEGQNSGFTFQPRIQYRVISCRLQQTVRASSSAEGAVARRKRVHFLVWSDRILSYFDCEENALEEDDEDQKVGNEENGEDTGDAAIVKRAASHCKKTSHGKGGDDCRISVLSRMPGHESTHTSQCIIQREFQMRTVEATTRISYPEYDHSEQPDNDKKNKSEGLFTCQSRKDAEFQDQRNTHSDYNELPSLCQLCISLRLYENFSKLTGLSHLPRIALHSHQGLKELRASRRSLRLWLVDQPPATIATDRKNA
eukprot:768465-Hanusia_phi.AAC.2